MSILKRILGNYINGHQNGYRNSRHGGKSNSHHGRKGYYNDFSSNNDPQGVRCPQCQTYNAPEVRFCVQCGQGIQNTLCGCGGLITAGAKFCGQCGRSI